MKNPLFMTGFVALISVLVLGCATTTPKKQTEVSVVSEFSGRYTITAQYNQFGDSFYERANPDKIINGFVVSIKNNTSANIKINWNNSSIMDSENTHRVFLSGQKYINANDDIPPLVVPPNGNVTRTVCSADHVEYVLLAKTWRVNPMRGFTFTLVLCIEDQGKENYV